jgi:hypothetical protein
MCRQLRPENTSSAQCHGFIGRAFFGYFLSREQRK